MNQRGVIPCMFYYYIHYMLKEKYREGTVLSTKDAMKFFFEWRLPEKIRPVIIKELETLGLIKRINKKSIEINGSDFDLKDLRGFYKAVGIY